MFLFKQDCLKIVHAPSLLDKAFEELGYGSAADAVEWLNHGGGIREVNAAWLPQILVEPMPHVLICSHSALKYVRCGDKTGKTSLVPWGEIAPFEASEVQEFLRRAHQDEVHSVPRYSSLSVQMQVAQATGAST